VTTVYLIGLTIALLIIPGIGAAIYLTEYARYNWWTRAIPLRHQYTGGVPSIVSDSSICPLCTVLHFNFLYYSRSLDPGLLLLPTLISTTEEAILACTAISKRAGLSLGATKWQTIFIM
jgi:phosphate transport system permease protein